MFAAVPIDWQLTDTYFVVAHFHYVLIGGMVFAVFAATYYWFPKITGRMLDERLGKVQFWLWVIGFNGTFMVQHFLGVMGMPRRVYTYADNPGWAMLNGISSGRCRVHGRRHAGAAVEHRQESAHGRAGRRQPLGCLHAGVGHHLAAAAGNFDSSPRSKAAGPCGTSNIPDLADWKIATTPEDSGRRARPREVGRLGVRRLRSDLLRAAVGHLCGLQHPAITATAPRPRRPSTSTRTGVFTVPARQQPDLLDRRTEPARRAAEALSGLARRHDPAGHRVPRRPGLGICRPVVQRHHHRQQSVRLDVLHRHRLSRAARHGRPVALAIMFMLASKDLLTSRRTPRVLRPSASTGTLSTWCGSRCFSIIYLGYPAMSDRKCTMELGVARVAGGRGDATGDLFVWPSAARSRSAAGRAGARAGAVGVGVRLAGRRAGRRLPVQRPHGAASAAAVGRSPLPAAWPAASSRSPPGSKTPRLDRLGAG